MADLMVLHSAEKLVDTMVVLSGALLESMKAEQTAGVKAELKASR